MKTITSFKIAGLITACLFAAMPTKADIGAISFKTSAAGMNALETTIGSNQMTLETWLYIDIFRQQYAQRQGICIRIRRVV